MTLVVLGVDALDHELIDEDRHPNLVLDACRPIDTIVSDAGSPSTHELWPTIITGLRPEEHGLTLDDGVAWQHPLLRYGSRIAEYMLPDILQTRIGAFLLNNTSEDAFRIPATYYEKQGIETIFDGIEGVAIGVPNYVVDPDTEDQEHLLRRQMGDLFMRDPDAKGGHTSTDPSEFYEFCLEMSMVRIARVRRALRSRRYELVFGYTSGLDLLGHVAHNSPGLQSRSYDEVDEFVGELRADLDESDELMLVSDHGLQNGVHTETAVISATAPDIITDVGSVLDVRDAIDAALHDGSHKPTDRPDTGSIEADENVRNHLENLGYM